MRARGMALLVALDMAETANKRPDALSGGQRQRTAVARALANDPQIRAGRRADRLAGHAQCRRGVRRCWQGSREEGRTVIAVTHDEGLARMAPRRVHLVDGRVVRDGRQD